MRVAVTTYHHVALGGIPSLIVVTWPGKEGRRAWHGEPSRIALVVEHHEFPHEAGFRDGGGSGEASKVVDTTRPEEAK